MTFIDTADSRFAKDLKLAYELGAASRRKGLTIREADYKCVLRFGPTAAWDIREANVKGWHEEGDRMRNHDPR